MNDTAKTSLIAGIFALMGAIGGASITGWSQVQLARQKFNSDLVLKALESGSAEERLESLKLLVETKLLKDDDVREAVMNYAKKKEEDPSSIPQVSSSTKFEAPVVGNARIYLLAGNEVKKSLFDEYRNELESAGFQVLGSKVLNDQGRPSDEEIRYFYEEDSVQASKIAEVVKFKLSKPGLNAHLMHDKSVNRGYIEIWFGK